jgi:hypothetical protein
VPLLAALTRRCARLSVSTPGGLFVLNDGTNNTTVLGLTTDNGNDVAVRQKTLLDFDVLNHSSIALTSNSISLNGHFVVIRYEKKKISNN